MRRSSRIAILIPCRNEALALPGLLEELRGYLPEIVVVDDGSTDETASIARRMGAECIGLWPGQGKGAALQAGFRHLERRGFSHALTLDGDGQHCPGDIPGFLSSLEETRADLIVGRRRMKFGVMPWPRLAVNRVMSAC